MDYNDHKHDHDRILKAVDCSQDVAKVVVEVALLKEWKQEQKEDATKQLRVQMWFAGICFSIIMAVSANLISSQSTVSVLQEKVTEQKQEIKDLKSYIGDVIDQMNTVIGNHAH